MHKYVHLKEWLTTLDSAIYLSTVLEDEINEADVLQLALDGHLTLSVLFANYAFARFGTLVLSEAGSADPTPPPSPSPQPTIECKTVAIGKDEILRFSDDIASIDGVWDLPLVASERRDVQNRLHELTGGPRVWVTPIDGTLVRRPDGVWAQLQDLDEESLVKDGPLIGLDAVSLPDDGVFVVRTAELADFQVRLLSGATHASATSLDKPLGERERATHLTIIAALAAALKIDTSKHSSAGAEIERLTELIGARVAGRTIAGYLAKLPDALERTSKVSS
jgi:hypothetical protein